MQFQRSCALSSHVLPWSAHSAMGIRASAVADALHQGWDGWCLGGLAERYNPALVSELYIAAHQAHNLHLGRPWHHAMMDQDAGTGRWLHGVVPRRHCLIQAPLLHGCRLAMTSCPMCPPLTFMTSPVDWTCCLQPTRHCCPRWGDT